MVASRAVFGPDFTCKKRYDRNVVNHRSRSFRVAGTDSKDRIDQRLCHDSRCDWSLAIILENLGRENRTLGPVTPEESCIDSWTQSRNRQNGALD